MYIRSWFRRWPLLRYAFACTAALLAVAIQFLIQPVTGSDTYQVFLGAVALSVIFGGTRSGLVTLALTGAAKLFLIVLPGTTLPAQTHVVVARMALFISVGLVICWIGGQLHASERTLNAVLGGIEDGVIATDENGYVRFMNPIAQEATGFGADEPARLRDVARFLEQPSGREIDLGPGLTQIPTPFPDKAVLVSQRGDSRPVEGSAAIVQDSPGAEKRVVIVFRDLTERRRAEAERERLIGQLQEALAKVKQLRGLLPICASCKKIRDDQGYWHQLESYIRNHSEADFSHGICPECARALYPEIVGEQPSAPTGR